MKIISILLISIVTNLFTLGTYAQSPDTSSKSANAKINFIRRTGINGFADLYNIFIDGKLICKLSNDRFSTKVVDSGQHIIVVQTDGEHVDERIAIPLKIALKSGETYYIQVDYEENTALYKLYCFIISEKRATELLENCLKKPECN